MLKVLDESPAMDLDESTQFESDENSTNHMNSSFYNRQNNRVRQYFLLIFSSYLLNSLKKIKIRKVNDVVQQQQLIHVHHVVIWCLPVNQEDV